MKKVLHIALSNNVFPNGGWQKAFEENEYEYHSVNWQAVKRINGRQGMWEKIFYECEKSKPDLIFSQIQTPGIIGIYEAKRLSEYGFTVNYTMDVREDLSWFEDIAEHIGLLLFCDYESVEQMKAKGIMNVGYMMQSCDTDFYKAVETDKNYGEIIFIGSRYDNTNLNFPFAQERTDMVEFMKKEFSERFKVYGRGFGEILNPQQERDAYNSCKIAIGHNLFHRKGYSSDRQSRIIASGAFGIHQYYQWQLTDYYMCGLWMWRTLDELKESCHAVLDMRPLRMILFKEGVKDKFLKYHTWTERIRELNSLIKKHLSGELCK